MLINNNQQSIIMPNKFTNKTSAELDKLFKQPAILFQNQLFEGSPVDNIQYILSTTKYTVDNILDKLGFADINIECDKIIEFTNFIIDAYNVEIHNLSQRSFFKNPISYLILLDRGLDPSAINFDDMAVLLENITDKHVEFFQRLINIDPMYMNEFFEEKSNAILDKFNIAWYDNSAELFDLFINSGMTIGSRYFEKMCDYYNEFDSFESTFTSEFAIYLINLHKTRSDVFIGDSYKYLMQISLKFCDNQTIQYIIDNDIDQHIVKEALDTSNIDDPRIDLMCELIDKCKNLNARDIVNLCLGNKIVIDNF